MKKTLWIALILILVCVFSLSACNNSNSNDDGTNNNTNQNPNESSHAHSFDEWETVKNATCSSEGLQERYCSCGEKQTRTLSITNNHSFGEWRTVKNATCIQDGEKERSCSCGVTEKQEIQSSGHTEVIDKAVAATCTQNGKTEGKHCSVCNKVIVAQQSIPAGHTEVIDKAVAATCTTSGKTEGKHCSVCNKVIIAQQTTAIISHDYVKGKCSMCGNEEIHSMGLSYSVNFEKGYVVVTGIGTCTDSTVKIPSHQQGLPVLEIDSYAFYQNNTIKKVIIPETITIIGYRAFRESKLEEIIIPDTVKELGGQAFYNCYYLTNVSIPSTLEKLGTNVFGMCKNANFSYYNDAKYLGNTENPYLILVGSISKSQTVRVHEKTKFISYNAYIYDKTLTTIYLPETLVSIDECAFYSCSNLTTINYAGTMQQWNNVWKYYCWDDGTSYSVVCKDGTI